MEGTTEALEGPSLHRHKIQDEWWYIIEGQFKFEVDGQTVFAGPGDTVFRAAAAATRSRTLVQNRL